MLYIYLSMLVSGVLCVSGVAVAVVDIQRYNFGLYLALVFMVGFAIATAFFVVKPSLCSGPRWFAKLQVRTGSKRRRRKTAILQAFAPSAQLNGLKRRDDDQKSHFFGLPRSLPAVQICVEQSEPINNGQHRSSLDQRLSFGRRVAEPTTTAAPPTPTLPPPISASAVAAAATADGVGTPQTPATPPILPPMLPFAAAAIGDRALVSALLSEQQKQFLSRNRAWTYDGVGSHSPVLQQLVYQARSGALLQLSFPFSERCWPAWQIGRASSSSSAAAAAASGQSNQDDQAQRFSRSADDVVPVRRTPSELYPSAVHLSAPTAAAANATATAGKCWRRSNTILVKCVPVKEEWVPKPLGSTTFRRRLRKRSKSTNALISVQQAAGGVFKPQRLSMTSIIQRNSRLAFDC